MFLTRLGNQKQESSFIVAEQLEKFLKLWKNCEWLLLTETLKLVNFVVYVIYESGENAPKTLALSLSSRKNLCIHPAASVLEHREAVVFTVVP